MPNQSLRLFAAVPIPAHARAELERIAGSLRRRISAASPAETPPARWINPRDAHITLKFIGDWPAHDAPRLGAVIAEAAAAHPPFELALGKIGAFPNRGSPRVLWVGVHGALTRLAKLRDAVERALVDSSCAPQLQPFSPHITIARIPAALPRHAAAPLRRAIRPGSPAEPPPPQTSPAQTSPSQTNIQSNRPFTVDSVVLYRSSLAASGAAYAPLATAPLRPP